MRLQRYLALAGVASRRAAEELIVAGRVAVDGRIVRELGTTVGEEARVTADGRPVAPPSAQPLYLILNKPAGVMTTMRDPEGRRTVADLLRSAGQTRRVVPVGRLDYDTAGLLLLTDDGELAHVLTHPRFGVEKTYRVTIRGRPAPETMARIAAGIRLDDGRTRPARLRVVAARRSESVLDITIHDGRNRQVRRTFEALGHPVLALVRLRFGPLALGSLAPGALRPCTEREVAALRTIRQDARAREGAEEGTQPSTAGAE